MSILASLARAYERLPNAPPYGYAATEAGFCIVLRNDGSVAFDPIDLRLPSQGKQKRQTAPKRNLPTFLVQRTSKPRSNFLWDKSAYVLGRTSDGNAEKENAEFARFHCEVLSNATDAGLMALKCFVDRWPAVRELVANWHPDILDANIVFALEGDHRREFLHERPAAVHLWADIISREPARIAMCLVTGSSGRTADSHPPIKGVQGAQSSGAFIVSYNDQAYLSYGHSGGDNAPVSEAAAFAYTTALNRFLERDSGHRIQIGDASTVFWADASDADLAKDAEAIFWGMTDPAQAEKSATAEVKDKLDRIRAGKPLVNIEPNLADVRFFVLGLAPNAARLAIRFYYEDSFGALTRNYQQYLKDMAIEPWPEGRKLSIAASALRTAPARIEKTGVKFERDQISPLLSNELLRAILTGARFPSSLLSLLLLRVRSDHLLDAQRIALIKGVIVRAMCLDGRMPQKPDGTPKEDYLVRSDPNDTNDARRLGRLFALIERAQLTALGDGINATVKDKFLSAAAATPGQVFSGLLENAENHHLKRLRNGHSDAEWVAESAKKSGKPVSEVARRVGAALNADIGRLAGTFGEGFPAQHTVEQQGIFLVGYYQERYGRKKDDADGPDEDEATVETTNNEGEE